MIQMATRAARGRVFLVLPPNPDGYDSVRDFEGGLGRFWRGTSHPSPVLDLLYAAAVSEQLSWKTTVVDGPALRLKPGGIGRAIRELLRREPRTVGVPLFVGIRVSLATLNDDLALARDLKEEIPTALVFVFGNAIKHTIQDWIASVTLDFVLYGEPDALIPRLLNWAQPESSERPVLLGDESQGTVNWQYARDLDAIPFPAWHLLPLDDYCPTGKTDVLYFVQTTRGCPKPCTMCPYALNQGRVWRKRSIAQVVDELAYLKKEFGARYVQLRDPNIGIDTGRLRMLGEQLCERDLGICLHIETDLERLDRDTLRLLRRAGVEMITTGVESVDPSCLESIDQNPDIPRVLAERIAFCRSIGIEVQAMFIVGFPNESWSTVLATLSFAKGLRCSCRVNVMTPYPGTILTQDLESAGLILPGHQPGSYRHFREQAVLVRSKHMSSRELFLAWVLLRTELRSSRAYRTFAQRRSLGSLRDLIGISIAKAILSPIYVYARLRCLNRVVPNRVDGGSAVTPPATRSRGQSTG